MVLFKGRYLFIYLLLECDTLVARLIHTLLNYYPTGSSKNFYFISLIFFLFLCFILVHLAVYAMATLVYKISERVNLLVESKPRLKKIDEKIASALNSSYAFFAGKSKKERFFYAVCVFFFVIACGKLYFILLNKTYEYKGTIFSSYTAYTDASSDGRIPSKLHFFFINPRNFTDYINIDMTRAVGDEWKVVSLPVFEKDKITFLVSDKQHRVFAWQVTKHKKEAIPLPGIVNENGLVGSLYKIDNFWFYTYKNFIYKIDDKTQSTELVAKNKDENIRLLLEEGNVGYVNSSGYGEFLLKDKQIFKFGRKVLGYYIPEKEFLIYNRYFEGTYLTNGEEEPRKYSSQDYRILANGPDVTIMLMLATDEPTRRSFDYEFTFLDMIRTDWRLCKQPFIYNTKLNDVVNLPLTIEGMEQDYSAYFAEDYNRETLEALRDTMYRTDHSFVEQ